MKGETKNPENAVENTIQMIKTCCVSCKKNTANENSSVKRTKKKINACIKLYCLWRAKIKVYSKSGIPLSAIPVLNIILG